MAGVVATAVAAGCSGGDGDDAAPPTSEGATATPGAGAALPPVPPSLPADAVRAWAWRRAIRCPTSVILWTRLVSDPLVDGGGLPDQPLPVRWEVAASENFDDIVASGAAVAEPALGHSVHVDARASSPTPGTGTASRSGERTSPVGTHPHHARPTAPTSTALRFAFASCQDYQDGYWPAHTHLADEDVDLVVFLGRLHLRGRARRRTRSARCDRRRRPTWPATGAATASTRPIRRCRPPTPRCRGSCTWDDHEVANNYAAEVPDGVGGRGRRRRVPRPSGRRLPGLVRAHAGAGRAARRSRRHRVPLAALGRPRPLLRARRPPVPQRPGVRGRRRRRVGLRRGRRRRPHDAGRRPGALAGSGRSTTPTPGGT